MTGRTHKGAQEITASGSYSSKRFSLLLAWAATALVACGSPESGLPLENWERSAGRHLAGARWEKIPADAPLTYPLGASPYLLYRARLPRSDAAPRDPVIYSPLINQSFDVFLIEPDSKNDELKSTGKSNANADVPEETDAVIFSEKNRIYSYGDPLSGRAGLEAWPFQLIPLPDDFGGRMIYIRVYSEFNPIGITRPIHVIGRADILKEIAATDLWRFSMGILFLFAGIFTFVFYLRRRLNILAIFTLLCLAAGAYVCSNRTLRIQHLLLDAPSLWMAIEHISIYCIPIGLGLFFQTISRFKKLTIFLWGMHLTFLIVALIGQLTDLWPFHRTLFPFFYLTLISVVASIVVLVVENLRKNQEARVITLGGLVFLIIAGYDLLGALGHIPWPGQLITWGFFAFLLSMGVVLEGRFTENHSRLEVYSKELEQAHAKLKDYAENLETKVDDRTQELNATLTEVRALKNVQDADYYLISLLMKPMHQARLESERIKIDMLVRQKKTFQAGERSGSIGGDLCLAREITLDGRPCVVFLNADAMGKSIQGAGGAIVVGVVFQTFFNSQNVPEETGRSPEALLEACYRQLQITFHTFDGVMMSTLVLGLLDESTGILYHVSAQHPPLILLRDGRAEFVESSPVQKIGIQLDVLQFSVHRTLLQPGDVLIAGSDGRDDILLAADPDEGVPGESTMNEDERRILGLVEQTDGRPDELLERLGAGGEFSDDVSLLRLEFTD